MAGKSTWEAFFDAHASVYEDNVFTKNTLQEVDFLLEELSLQRATRFLTWDADRTPTPSSWPSALCCHGNRLVLGMLARAREAAKAAGVNVEWIHSDATRFSLPKGTMVRFACARELSGFSARRMTRLVSPCPSCAISLEA